jgi:hypothetical protein
MIQLKYQHMMPRFVVSWPEMVVGRFFGLGTDLSTNEIESSCNTRAKHVHICRRFESDGDVADKRGESLQRVSANMDTKASTINGNLEGDLC